MADKDTLSNFLKYLNQQDTTNLMKQFCGDDPNSTNPKFPCLGITDHGPAFYGNDDVKLFFNQLFKSFPDMQWVAPPPSQPNAPQLTAADTIGIQMTVTGKYADEWFQPPTLRGQKDHTSLPLSQLPKTPGSPLGARKGDHNGTPAFAVFSFDKKSYLIRQIQIYLDRYAMMQTIELGWTPDGDSLAAATSERHVIRGGRGRNITITIET
jgi:hypothetical protein